MTVARGADHWQVFVRLAAAGSPEHLGEDRRVLRLLAGADAGQVHLPLHPTRDPDSTLLGDRDWTPYACLGLGAGF